MRPGELPAWLADPRRRPLIVGILNATPDSFSDGGRFLDADDAADHVRRMVNDGADWVDVGGESTRPGSEPVATREQLARVLPPIRAAVAAGVVACVDTSDAAVAEAALGEGASVVNDVTAARGDARMPATMARADAVVLMHMLGTPRTMQDDPRYDDVVAEVSAFLKQRVAALADAGVEPSRVLLDPGIGFGKTRQHNLRLLAATRELAGLGHPLYVGASRKRFLGDLTGEPDADRRQFGTAAAVAWCAAAGVAAHRVHDVRAMRQVLDVVEAVRAEADAAS